jgi:S1-C subfamily serine protease
MRKPNLWQITALILIVASLFVCVGMVGLVTGMMLVPQQADTPLGVKTASAAPMAPATTTPQAHQPDLPLTADQEERLLESIYRRASASVVHIRVGNSTSSSAPPMPYDQEFPRQGEGSGFVWDTAGHIVTNYHVIENADTIEVEFFDGTTVRARLIGGVRSQWVTRTGSSSASEPSPSAIPSARNGP